MGIDIGADSPCHGVTSSEHPPSVGHFIFCISLYEKKCSLQSARAADTMRLLKTDGSFEIIERFGNDIPAYAILSHTWGSDEVSFADIQDGHAATRMALPKLQHALKQASRDGYKYLWVDTCCIDKTSSAELSEAINSMYSWYKNAAKCYAVLEDITSDAQDPNFGAQFRRSRWFTRGWTLQELLAPADLQFFSAHWDSLGSRTQLQQSISRTTSIEVDYLTHLRPLETASVAARMSWAAGRQTTRHEDTAYCLLGLFSVNMPLLYGEGNRAFIRLQEEIMRQSDDHSIFAWTMQSKGSPDQEADGNSELKHGLLADSPAAFASTSSITSWNDIKDQTPYEMSNRGLSIDLHLTRLGDTLYAAALECHLASRPHEFLAIYLRKLETGPNQYARVQCHKLGRGSFEYRGSAQKVFVRQVLGPEQPSPPSQYFVLRDLAVDSDVYQVTDVVLPETKSEADPPIVTFAARFWVPAHHPTVFSVPKAPRTLGVALILHRYSDGERVIIMMGSISPFIVGFSVREAHVVQWTYSALQKEFARSVEQAGAVTTTECHGVQLQMYPYVEPHVQGGRKLYTVDINIQALPRKTLLEQASDVVAQKTAIRPHSKRVSAAWKKMIP